MCVRESAVLGIPRQCLYPAELCVCPLVLPFPPPCLAQGVGPRDATEWGSGVQEKPDVGVNFRSAADYL